MFTIGQVAKRYGLSRSTLIYYDKAGVLKPNGRSVSNYRLYSDSDLLKMDRIVVLRSAGLSLAAIAKLVDQRGDRLNATLELRLKSINGEIQGLRNQQQVILKLLQNESAIKTSRVITKETWVSLLQAAGLDDEGMRNWHIEFEKTSPEAHQDFLESIGIEKDEIQLIRAWASVNDEAGG
jgi:DNA-binding transcriptional MerR regulator